VFAVQELGQRGCVRVPAIDAREDEEEKVSVSWDLIAFRCTSS
jgi:hypothetical protein